MTDKTRGILSKEALAKTKPGVRIINCARGGLVDEAALAEAIKSGHVAGAGFDVFEVEPAKESPLFGLPLKQGRVVALDRTSALLAGLIRNQVADVNMVSAPIMIKEKGIVLSEVKRDKTGVYDGYIKLTVTTDKQTRSVAGTVFSDGKPRFIQIKGINMDADVGQNMIYISNTDVPGMIGFMGTTLGNAGVNIANFQLGREKEGGDAIALLYVDGAVDKAVLDQLTANAAIKQAKPLTFNVD